MNTRDLFEQLGLEVDWTEKGGKLPNYLIEIGDDVVEIFEGHNRWLQPTFQIIGSIVTPRSVSFIQSELPIEIETREQGLALLSHAIGKAVPKELKPAWLMEGEQLRSHLPWEKQKAAYQRRPRCSVDREWLRIAAKQLREEAVGADEKTLTIFAFDGEVLKLRSADRVMAMPARGSPWPEDAVIASASLSELPKRLTTPTIEIAIWEGALRIGRAVLALVPTERSPNLGRMRSRLDELHKLPFEEL